MSLLECPTPIVAAPMAGGPTTPELVAAVAGAGGLGFVAAGYLSADTLADRVAATRSAVSAAGGGDRYGVNLFVPEQRDVDAAAVRAYADRIAPDAERLGVTLDPEAALAAATDDDWGAKVELLVSDPVPVVSLTFGLPDRGDIARLQRAGSRVLATVTTADEARRAAAAGVDGLVVQGPGAGGHSATYDPTREIELMSTVPLVHEMRSVVDLPVVAAGGVAEADDVLDLLVAGAEAVQVGTLLLRADEAGTAATHRAVLADPAFRDPTRVATTLTRSFTGRPARALRNDFVAAHDEAAPPAYPALHHLTRPMRQAASAAGDPHRLHLWAGTGFRAARDAPAAEIVAELTARL